MKNKVGRWSQVVALPALAFLFCWTASAQQKPVVLRGGTLLTVTHGVIEHGTVVLEGGRITSVGPDNSVKVPKDARVIDVTGMTVYPGLIDSESNLGLTEI